ncbi:MAG TPA: outer membrane beta-barrel protein [Alphaproteobacteria bacterium]|nr:outer membrane beta-barrel protein [Alphaproteobacteria bacterium]
MKQSVHVLFLLAVALVGLASEPAQAQTGQFYIGASAGRTSFDTGIITYTASLDESSTGYKLVAGYNLNPNVAVEFTYADLGKATVSGNSGDVFAYRGVGYQFLLNNAEIKFEGTLIGAGGRFSFPVSRALSLYARLGLASWNIDATASAPGAITSTSSDSGTDPYYGAGIGWEFVPTVSLTAEYEHYELDTESADLMSIGIIKRF